MTKPTDPDNLRTRIAKVLYRCDWGTTRLRDWEKATYRAKQPYYADADAVIEALGLQAPGLQPDGSFIDPTGVVWRHTGKEWTDDPTYRP